MLTLLQHFRYATNIEFGEAVKCPSFFLLSFECTNSMLYFCRIHSVNTLLCTLKHSEYWVFRTEVPTTSSPKSFSPPGGTGVSKQRPRGLHGGVLRLSAGRGGPRPHRGSPESQGTSPSPPACLFIHSEVVTRGHASNHITGSVSQCAPLLRYLSRLFLCVYGREKKTCQSLTGRKGKDFFFHMENSCWSLYFCFILEHRSGKG